MEHPIPNKLYFSLVEAFKLIGCSYHTGKAEIRSENLKTIIIGKRQKITRKVLMRYLKNRDLI